MKTFTPTSRTRALAVLSTLGLSCALTLGAVPAHAVEEDSTEVVAISDAIDEVGAEQAAPNSDVTLPDNGGDAATLHTASGDLDFLVPAEGQSGSSAEDQRLFEGVSDGSSVAVQSTADGLRALIHIDSADAPERYDFQIGGDVATLELAADGSALAFNAAGDLISIAAVPWAIDADGRTVPTHFEVDGLNLTQVVEHHGGEFTYGIVADPWWNPFSWPWGKWVSKSKKVVGNALKKCGQGALVSTIGLGVGTGTTNVLIEKYGNNLAKIKIGGWQGYVGAAAAGCIINNL